MTVAAPVAARYPRLDPVEDHTEEAQPYLALFERHDQRAPQALPPSSTSASSSKSSASTYAWHESRR